MTEILNRHGFRGIRGRKSFYVGGSYSSSEWWHFQCESVLLPSVSTFGGELMKIYSEAEIKRSFCGDWSQARGATWGRDWH
jgi:hypothetical protein